MTIRRRIVAGYLAPAVLGLLAAGLIGTARAFGLEVVAAGIEQAEQAHFLLAQGCGRVQGPLFGRPVPAQDILGVITKDMRNAAADGRMLARAAPLRAASAGAGVQSAASIAARRISK